jgi:hypothetical protein
VQVTTELDVAEKLFGTAQFLFVAGAVDVEVHRGWVLEEVFKAGFAKREQTLPEDAFFDI